MMELGCPLVAVLNLEPVDFVNTLRLRRNWQNFADNIFKRIFFNENVLILIKISLKYVPEGPINNIPALVQIMAWHHPGDKPLSEPMMVSLLTHICVTRPQWVNSLASYDSKCRVFKPIMQNNSFDTGCVIALWWMPQNVTNEKSILVWVKASCHQATSHYLSQLWLLIKISSGNGLMLSRNNPLQFPIFQP